MSEMGEQKFLKNSVSVFLVFTVLVIAFASLICSVTKFKVFGSYLKAESHLLKELY